MGCELLLFCWKLCGISCKWSIFLRKTSVCALPAFNLGFFFLSLKVDRRGRNRF